MTPATIESLHATVFDLCCQYAHRDAHELRGEAQDWLREIAQTLEAADRAIGTTRRCSLRPDGLPS